jgi:hypothetical protein
MHAPADARIGLDDRNINPRLDQSACRGHPGGAGADHNNVRLRGPRSPRPDRRRGKRPTKLEKAPPAECMRSFAPAHVLLPLSTRTERSASEHAITT